MKKERIWIYQVGSIIGIFALREFTIRAFGIANFLLPGQQLKILKNYNMLNLK